MLTCSYGLLYIIHCLLIINDLGEVDCKTLFSTKVFPDDNVYLQNLGEQNYTVTPLFWSSSTKSNYTNFYIIIFFKQFWNILHSVTLYPGY